MLWYLVSAVLAVVIFHIFVFHKYNFPWVVKTINKIPGPEGVFYFGSTLRYWNIRNEDRLPAIVDSFQIWGSTFREWFSGVPTVFISELDDYQTVLGSRLHSSKGILYKHILPWLGRGLLTSSGDQWHTRRKIITPTFHFSILQSYVDIFNHNTKTLIQRLSQHSSSNPIELNDYICPCTLDNVCETAMGANVNAQSGQPSHYVQSIKKMGEIVCERMFSPILFPDANFELTPLGREHRRILKVLHNFTNRVISECKKFNPKLHSIVVDDESKGIGVYKNKMSFLKLLLEKQTEYRLSDKDIREEVDTFMFEGHDTTSVAINWTLFELGHNMEIQDECFKEQSKIFGSDNRMPTYKDVAEMSYLKRVIQETLRLYPSVPVISRKFDVDMQLKDYLIPADSEIVMCVFHHHRNPAHFPDPEKFDPDRFLPEASSKRHSFAYLPFSAGQRNCVGQKFAMLEMMIVVGSIIRWFKVQTITDRSSLKFVPELTLRPYQKLQWKISQRSMISQN